MLTSMTGAAARETVRADPTTVGAKDGTCSERVNMMDRYEISENNYGGLA